MIGISVSWQGVWYLFSMNPDDNTLIDINRMPVKILRSYYSQKGLPKGTKGMQCPERWHQQYGSNSS